ncbi:Hint domain-containing protein [Szabonella alba]|uniref:Hint domain-containing protein n=1 Tax=Szabonella alba TaxID=2804194 RepID=A0A8K0V8E7_9RHOB|nr:Hint domain-containing protein [Szabonella alba]MBL4917604.1 Hint domain-containing protein [Szabonella alba]
MGPAFSTEFKQSDGFQASGGLTSGLADGLPEGGRRFDPAVLLAPDAAERVLPVTSTGGLLAGMTVLTLRGTVPVGDLVAGDRVITRAGTRALRAVQSEVILRAEMIRVSASALGVDQPEEDLYLSPEQPVLVRDWRAQALKGQPQAVIPVGALIDGEYIRPVTVVGQRIFRLEFDGPVVLYAGGLELASVEG